ncbi:MAG TPA: dihydroorotate dehydrogenase [Candidatus Binatia bacterium]|nr:dihydroorotate dehydrogenase [Candidatus Binatia bacterium]
MSASQADRATRSPGVDLRVEVGSLSLQNPIIAASGTFGYGIEFAHLVDLNKLGGIVVKGLSIQPKMGNPAPRMCETTGGMLNSIGLQNVGVKGFIVEKLPKLRPYRVPIIANVFGETTAEYVEVIRILEDAEGVAAYELNISCPNVEHGGVEYSTDPSLTAEVVGAARKAATRPLWVKVSPAIGIIRLIAKEAENYGADALVVANTYPALCIDAHNRRSRIGSTTGGLSGAAVKPITVRLVNELSRVIRIPIIGLGGIETPTDVAEYMLAGASAVEVGTAHFADPRASEKLVEGLEKWCRDENLSEISSLRGALQTDQPRKDTKC